MYKLQKSFTANEVNAIHRLSDNSFIPFASDNTDYQAFKQDLANGVALSDAEGTAMTADQVKTFLETLP